MNQRTHHDKNLKVLWAYLHLGPFHRFGVLFPVVPIHSLGIDLAGDVQTIQVGMVATAVPPGTFKARGTVVSVIIAILGAKWLTTVITQRISSGAYQYKK